MKKKIILLFLSMLILPVLCFLFLEVATRWSIPEKIWSTGASSYEACAENVDTKYQLSVNLNHQPQQNLTFPHLFKKTLYKKYDFFEKTPSGYSMPKSNIIFRQRAVTADNGEIVFDVTYSFDRSGRRIAPHSSNAVAAQHLVVGGCSAVFGEGLEDWQTLPAQLQNKQPHLKIFNLGRSGGSVVDAIVMTQVTDAWYNITPQRGALLFLFSYNIHLERLLGTLMNIGRWNEWGAFLNEVPSGSGQFYFGGTYREQRPLRTWLSKMVARSQFLTSMGFDWPPQNEEALETYVRALKFLQQQYQQITDSTNPLVVYFRPGEKMPCSLIPLLEKYNIFYLDYSSFHISKYARSLTEIQYDGHPSAEYNRVLAEQISHDLSHLENIKKLHRKLF